MARWYLSLKGEALDLEEFPYWFPDGDIFCVKEGDNYLLTGAALADIACLEEARRIGDNLFERACASIALLWNAFKPPEIERYVEELPSGVRRNHHVLACVTGEVRSRGRAIIRIGGVRLQTAAQSIDQIVAKRHHLREALMIWSSGKQTWPRLYRIFEEIEADLGGRQAHLAELCSSTQRTRFTRSANSAQVSGRDSRHSMGKHPPPADPMTWDEAYQFVWKLLYDRFAQYAKASDLPM
jgi:hypothetical protein